MKRFFYIVVFIFSFITSMAAMEDNPYEEEESFLKRGASDLELTLEIEESPESLGSCELPIEVLDSIIAYNPEDHANLSLVCKTFNFLSTRNHSPYLLNLLNENARGLLEFKGRRLSIKHLIHILKVFEMLTPNPKKDDTFLLPDFKSKISLPPNFKSKRQAIFNYLYTLRWSPMFRKAEGPKILQDLAELYQINLQRQWWRTLRRSISRDPYLAIPFNILGLSGAAALLWGSISYIPGSAHAYANSPDLAKDLSCMWKFGGTRGGGDCSSNFYGVYYSCASMCASLGALNIPLSSLTNTSYFTEAISPVTQLAQSACNMTDPVGISAFIDTNRNVFTSFVNSGNNEDGEMVIIAANERLRLLVAYFSSYIHYLSTNNLYSIYLFQYDPTCIAERSIKYGAHLGYQIATSAACVVWFGFFIWCNLMGWM